jgi:hypothetical protein
VIAIDVAWTAPAESRVPLARKHSPVCKSVEDADEVRVTAAVVGTLITSLPEAAVSTVIDVPLAWVTSPATKGIGGGPEGVGLGEAAAGGEAFGPNWPPAPHPVEVLGERRTVVAVRIPAESFCPLATRHWPGTTSASTAADVLVKVVVLVYVTVTSPVAAVRIKVCPLIWTS